MRSLSLALTVVVLVAVCSGNPLCKMNLQCELILCGVPNCGPGYEVKLEPCSCCPGCVLADSQEQDQQATEMLKLWRHKRRTGGKARLQSKLWTHTSVGDNIPDWFKKYLNGKP